MPLVRSRVKPGYWAWTPVTMSFSSSYPLASTRGSTCRPSVVNARSMIAARADGSVSRHMAKYTSISSAVAVSEVAVSVIKGSFGWWVGGATVTERGTEDDYLPGRRLAHHSSVRSDHDGPLPRPRQPRRR